MSDIKTKKEKILKYIKKHMNTMDPSGKNAEYYEKLIGPMNDKQFKEFIDNVKQGKFQLHLIVPNMEISLKMENLLKAADNVGCKIFHRLWLTDSATGKRYLTPEEYPVLNNVIRRNQQYMDKKLSVPDSDTKIDGMTGQPTGSDKAASISMPESEVLYAQGYHDVILELTKVRGGDISAYGEFKRQLEETGAAELSRIDPNSRTRVSVVLSTLFKSMHIDNNL